MTERKFKTYNFDRPVSARDLEKALIYASDETGAILGFNYVPGKGINDPKARRREKHLQPKFSAEFRNHNMPLALKAIPIWPKERRKRDDDAFWSLKFYRKTGGHGYAESMRKLADDIIGYVESRLQQD